MGAAVDIPVAKLAQQKAKIDAQTEAYKLVEQAIAKAAASEAGADEEIVGRALEVLVHKAYRKQVNRNAVAAAMLDELGGQAKEQSPNDTGPTPQGAVGAIDDDWLNVFERYAEDASSERMQKLWGRVLAGEVRTPGRFSMRTLRFLSEFSQADALTFEEFSKISFGDSAPKKLAKPDVARRDIRNLIYLEANGLIQGASGVGLQRTMHFTENGVTMLREANLVIVFMGTPNTSVQDEILALTPLGQELVSLLPGRDARAAARAVAHAMRTDQHEEAFLGLVQPNDSVVLLEVLWQKTPTPPPFTDYTSAEG